MIAGKQAAKNTAESMPAGLKLADIYYVLFRQKWIVLGSLTIALIAAAVTYLGQRPVYWSEAKLLVRYVVEAKAQEAGVGAQTRPLDYAGESILNSEFEILTSLDLCEEVAAAVGPERVLGKGGSNVTAAAMVINS